MDVWLQCARLIEMFYEIEYNCLMANFCVRCIFRRNIHSTHSLCIIYIYFIRKITFVYQTDFINYFCWNLLLLLLFYFYFFYFSFLIWRIFLFFLFNIWISTGKCVFHFIYAYQLPGLIVLINEHWLVFLIVLIYI